MIRVFLAGRSPLATAGLAALFQGDSEIEIVGSADDGAESRDALSGALADENPDVVILELEPGQEKAELRKLAVNENFSDAAIILIGGDADSPLARDALRLGARAVLTADVTPGRLRAAIRAVAEGLIVLPGGDHSLAGPASALATSVGDELETLTPREREVLNLLAAGLGNKQIAAKLGISEHTAKFHVASILGKLGATSRTEAVAIGVRSGLVLL